MTDEGSWPSLRIHDYGLGNYMVSVRILGRKEEASALVQRAEVICSITMQKNEEEIGRKLECLVEEMAPGWRTELTFSIENDHLRVWRLRRLGRRKGNPSSFNRF